MKKIVILVSIIVLLLGASFAYLKFFDKEEEGIIVESGKGNVYSIELREYKDYYHELTDECNVYVKGVVSDVDDSDDALNVITISDDTYNSELVIYKHSYPSVSVGDMVYVNGCIDYSYEDENGISHYVIDKTDTDILLQEDDNTYLSVSEAVKLANSVYDDVFFEIEGVTEYSNNPYDYNYYLSDGSSRIAILLGEGLRVKDGDHLSVVGKPGGWDVLRVQRIKTAK